MKRIFCNQFQGTKREQITIEDLFGRGPTEYVWPINIELGFTEGSYGSNVAYVELRKGEGCAYQSHGGITVEKVEMGEKGSVVYHSYLKLMLHGSHLHSLSNTAMLRGMANAMLHEADRIDKEDQR